jgi:hypothetical protein
MLSDCDIILNVEINCVQRSYSGVTGKFNNVNREDYRNDILDVDLEDLCEIRHMAVRPRVREVMNALIVKLTHEVKLMKSNSKGPEAPGSKWTDVVVGTRNRNGIISNNITHNTTQNIPVINTMQISRVQLLPYTKKNSILSNQMPMGCFATLELAKEKINTKHKMVFIEDSRARGCVSKLREKFKEQYEVTGYVIKGADAVVLTKTAQQEIKGLTEKDILILLLLLLSYTHILWRNK